MHDNLVMPKAYLGIRDKSQKSKLKKAVLNLSTIEIVKYHAFVRDEDGNLKAKDRWQRLIVVSCPRKMRRQCRKTLPFKESDKKRIRIN